MLVPAHLLIVDAAFGGPCELWYARPADEWTEALPVGNGRMGAMVFGGIQEERIQLNEESVWAGPPTPSHKGNLKAVLDEARRLLFAGNPAAAQDLIANRFMAEHEGRRSYQTLGDLVIQQEYPGIPPTQISTLAGWKRSADVSECPQSWVTPDFDDAAWKEATDRSVAQNSEAVFRTTFRFDKSAHAGAVLHLSPIDDESAIYVNGFLIGRTTQYDRPHAIDISAALQSGDNLVAIRVRNFGGPGHFAETVRLKPIVQHAAYRRSLDLSTAVATTMFEVSDVVYRREVFVSHPDDVIAVRFTATQRKSVALRLKLARPEGAQFQLIGNSGAALIGRASHGEQNPGVKFAAAMRVVNVGGTIRGSNGEIEVMGANSVTVLISAATDYNKRDPRSPMAMDLLAVASAKVDAAANREYEQLKARSVEDHSALFSRVSLFLGQAPESSFPTDVRLRNYADGKRDPALEALYFQFGRYLLVCSSRPHDLPANLQGVWNEHMVAPWNSDYHTNINLQMNYWPAEVTNLSECHDPLFDFTDMLRINGRVTARQFGCQGFVVGHTTDLWGWCALSGLPVWGMWPHGGGWLSAHFMEHYRFTLDLDFLRDRAYPILRESAEFYLDWLTEDPETGLLVSGPTTSPENTYILDGKHLNLSMGTTMDQQIIRENFENVLEAARILSIRDAFTQRVESALVRLSPTRVGPDGRILEWARQYEEAEPGHRHMSHLYALHPSNQIGMDRTPDLAKAARKTLEFRLASGGGHTGWSRAWVINFWARLREAEHAHENLRLLLAKSTLTNLFDNHPPFQIDGNFGGCAGVAEMLLQSHEDRIALLPCLPRAWPNGYVAGLRARGGWEVSQWWSDGKLTKTLLKRIAGDGAPIISWPQNVVPTAARINSKDCNPLEIPSVPRGSTLEIRFAARGAN